MAPSKVGRGGGGTNSVTNHGSISVNNPPNVVPPVSGATSNDPVDNCGTCNIVTGLDAVGCDRCNRWFHPTSMCMGINDVLISGILSDGGGAVLFVCTDCRICSSRSVRGGKESESAFSQLFQTVKKLCENVQTLSAQVATLTSGPSHNPSHNVSSLAGLSNGQASYSAVAGQPNPLAGISPEPDQLRALIRREAREMEERQKRRESIIIRGIEAQTVDSFLPVFNRISEFLIGTYATPTNIMCIDKDKRLFRAKINDDSVRKQLLDNAKKLRTSPFLNVYLNRDLTYQQRGEMRARRAALLQNQATGVHNTQTQLITTPATLVNGVRDSAQPELAVGGTPAAGEEAVPVVASAASSLNE